MASRQIDHPLRAAANSADGDDAETEGTRRGHECRHRNSGVAHRGEDRLHAALHDLFGAGFLNAEARFIEVREHRDEYRNLCAPWQAARNCCDTCAAGRLRLLQFKRAGNDLG